MPVTATRPDPPTSYSVLELVALAPVRNYGSWLTRPLIHVLAYQDLDKLLPSTAVFLVVRIECPGFRWLHRRRANAHV